MNSAAQRRNGSAAPRPARGYTSLELSPQGAARRSDGEHRLLQALASAGTGIWEWDPVSDRVQLSEAAAFMFFGVAEDMQQVPLQSMIDKIDAADRERVELTLQATLEQKTGYEIHYRVNGGDGAKRWVVVRGRAECDARGNLRRVVGTLTDISERMRALQQLRDSEERFSALAESTTQIVWFTGPKGELRHISPAFARHTGIDPGLRGQRLLRALHPEDRAGTLRAWRSARRRGQACEFEFRLRGADGGYSYFRDNGVPLRGGDGEIREWLHTCTNVDALKRAQLRTSRSEERFRTYVESTTQLLWMADASGAISGASGEFRRITGAEEGAALGSRWVELVHPDHRSRAAAVWQHAVTSGSKYEVEFPMRVADGSYRFFRAQAAPLRDADGAIQEWIGTLTDIDAQKRAEEALQASEQKLLRLNRVYAVLSGINQLIVRARSREQLFTEACRVAVEQGKFRLAWIGELVGGQIRQVASFGDVDDYVEAQLRVAQREAVHAGNPIFAALRDLRGSVFNDVASDARLEPWREATLARGLRSAVILPLAVRGTLAGCIGLYAGESGYFDAQEMTLLNELAGDIAYSMESLGHRQELEYLAYYDGLTGLANRRMFSERLERLMLGARENGDGVAVALLDLAHFKTVNDTLGMPAGDELLKMMARRLVRLAGGRHKVARLGSDQFAVALPGIRSQADLEPLLRDRTWNLLNRPYALRGQHLHVPARAGIALFPQDAADALGLIQNAEAALKKAKAGGERCLLYAQEMSARLKQRLQAETRLRRAVEQNEFLLHYQPRVDLRDGSICGVEALLRWNCPERGLVPPGEFVPDLEQTGLIVEAGRWVLERAVADHRGWLAQGLAAPRIAVNVSAVQLRQPDFVECLRRIACAPGGAAAGLELEVTESMLMQDIEQKIVQLREVRAMGIPVAIDDFGTGYSSLSYLSRLPISAIKVDRSFVETLTASPDTMGIVSTIISLAHSMSLRVVAEGVATPEQVKFLRLLRCDEIQGYLFSKPVAEAEIAEMLRRGAKL